MIKEKLYHYIYNKIVTASSAYIWPLTHKLLTPSFKIFKFVTYHNRNYEESIIQFINYNNNSLNKTVV